MGMFGRYAVFICLLLFPSLLKGDPLGVGAGKDGWYCDETERPGNWANPDVCSCTFRGDPQGEENSLALDFEGRAFQSECLEITLQAAEAALDRVGGKVEDKMRERATGPDSESENKRIIEDFRDSRNAWREMTDAACIVENYETIIGREYNAAHGWCEVGKIRRRIYELAREYM